MLPTFVIGLREGLEAALIVGIIAAFLRKQGRRDLLRWVLIGVGAAIALCVVAGIALDAYSRNLPQRQQEGLETVIGVLAVGMVTYMVIWMRRNARQLKGQLEGMAADAMTGRSKAGRAMVLMAFLAVIREGMETVVFLLAAFNETGSGSASGFGAALGIVVAIVLGYGIYRGGVRLNLSKFFRATGLVLVLVAAGLVVNALHTAHEAGWLNVGQGGTVDLSRFVQPGSVQASLLTGMLGVQSRPVLIEVIGWLIYLVPVGLYVAWPPGKAVPARMLNRVGVGVGLSAAIGAVVLAVVAPSRPPRQPTTDAGAVTARIESPARGSVLLRTQAQQPIAKRVGALHDYRLSAAGSGRRAGVDTEIFRADLLGTAAGTLPAVLVAAKVAELNGGRLPIGLVATGGPLVASYRDAIELTVWLDTRTDRVIDLAWSERVDVTVHSGTNAFALDSPVATGRAGLPAASIAGSAAAATRDNSLLDRRSTFDTFAVWCVVLAVAALGLVAALALTGRRRQSPVVPLHTPESTLVRT